MSFQGREICVQAQRLRHVPCQLALSSFLHDREIVIPGHRMRAGFNERISPRASSATPDTRVGPLLAGYRAALEIVL